MRPRGAPSVQTPRRPPQETVDEIAARALAFIAADEERLSRFFAETGLAPGDLRAAAASPTFASSLLAHLAADERCFVAFAREIGYDPAALDRIRLALSPEAAP